MPRPQNPLIRNLLPLYINYKNSLHNEDGSIKSPSDVIWKTLAKLLDYKISKKYIYTIYLTNRHNCRYEFVQDMDINQQTYEDEEDEGSVSIRSSSNSDETIPAIRFVISLSAQEWLDIHPQNKLYADGKSYFVLPKEKWTPIIASHFWDHTKLPCALVFKRGKAYKRGDIFLSVEAQCKDCHSELKGIIREEPAYNRRALIRCVYSGGFQNCKNSSKRPTSGIERRRIAKVLTSTRVSLYIQYSKQKVILILNNMFEFMFRYI